MSQTPPLVPNTIEPRSPSEQPFRDPGTNSKETLLVVLFYSEWPKQIADLVQVLLIQVCACVLKHIPYLTIDFMPSTY